MKKNQQPWARQSEKGESPDSYQLFWVFLELGIKRSLQGVAEESGLSLSQIGKLSAEFKWAPRARAFDKHLIDISMSVIESKTKSDAVFFAKKEAEYRHEALGYSEELMAKAREMLSALTLHETVTETVTDVVGEGGHIIHVPTKVIVRPVRWNAKDMIAIAEFSDKLKRMSLNIPTSRVAVEANWIADPVQRLAQAKAMMMNWIKTRLDTAIQKVCLAEPNSDPVVVRAKLLSELPIWFAENYDIADPSALFDALPQEGAPGSTALTLGALSLHEDNDSFEN